MPKFQIADFTKSQAKVMIKDKRNFGCFKKDYAKYEFHFLCDIKNGLFKIELNLRANVKMHHIFQALANLNIQG